MSAALERVRPTFSFGGGPTFTTNRLADYTALGWNGTAGGGAARQHVELLGQLMFNNTGVKSRIWRGGGWHGERWSSQTLQRGA